MTWMKKLWDLVNFEVSWSVRSPKTSLHETMIIKKKYDERYHDKDYYERHNNEGSRFNPKLDILEFERRMHVDDFLDWLNTVESVFENPPHPPPPPPPPPPLRA